MKPIIHVYALCWNEERIIPFFLDHYSSIADKIFVYDNESNDSSINLLLKDPKVTIRSYKSDGKLRDDFYLTIKNHEWKASRDVADIVIICDMDEFLYTDNLAADLLSFYQSDATIINPTGYNMIVEEFDFNQKNEPLTNQIKTGVVDFHFNKYCAFKPNKITEINYLHGCHIAKPSGDIKFTPINFKLLHYKYITLQYVLDRMVSYKSRLSDFNKKFRLGFQYEYENQEHINVFNKILMDATKII